MFFQNWTAMGNFNELRHRFCILLSHKGVQEANEIDSLHSISLKTVGLVDYLGRIPQRIWKNQKPR